MEKEGAGTVKKNSKLVLIGLMFLLLLQVQANGQEKVSVWGGKLASDYRVPSGLNEKLLDERKVNTRSKSEQHIYRYVEYAKPQLVVKVVPAAKPVDTPVHPFKRVSENKGKSAAQPKISTAVLRRQFSDILFYSGSSKSKNIALTFDDGPSEVSSDQVLDVLKKYNIKATFFLLGGNVAKYPQVVKRMFEEGHVVAGHSWSHGAMDKVSAGEMQKQLDTTEDAIFQLTGKNIALFRPPYGTISKGGLECLDTSGYKVINWSVDSCDWKYPNNINQVRINTFRNIKGGSIILFHTVAGKEPSKIVGELLPEIILTLQSQGYQFVTVDELLSVSAYQTSSQTQL